MPHIHAQIDFVVSAFILNSSGSKVLLVQHRKLNGWFPPGGHIELHETPDDALWREIWEETGLLRSQLTVLGPTQHSPTNRWDNLPDVENHNTCALITPYAMDVHDFPPLPGHRHVAFVYMLQTSCDDVWLEESAHVDIRWCDREDLEGLCLLPSITDYCRNLLNNTTEVT